ncbi:MAG TPA: hypothetical protein VHH73_02965, partial [Verrucomicrobiae bacterium]|nr:hypothetical protein [Verrucomicrobiae bacterium]
SVRPAGVVKPAANSTTWNRQALVGAGSLGNVAQGQSVSVPLYVSVAEGYSLSGLLFNAVVTAEGDAPALKTPVRFVLADKVPGGTPVSFDANSVGYGWNIGAFAPSLTGSNLLGFIQFSVPDLARGGQTYTVHFTKADGSPDIDTQYDLESAHGSVVVAAPAPAGAHFVSDDWQVHFFGSVTNPSAQAEADPDGDGIPNWGEYAAGSNPLDAQSSLRLAGGISGGKAVLSWPTVIGRVYVLERSTSVLNPVWAAAGANVAGTGGVVTFTDPNPPAGTAFYRVRVVAP